VKQWKEIEKHGIRTDKMQAATTEPQLKATLE
jgi:hypothetical protein